VERKGSGVNGGQRRTFAAVMLNEPKNLEAKARATRPRPISGG